MLLKKYLQILILFLPITLQIVSCSNSPISNQENKLYDFYNFENNAPNIVSQNAMNIFKQKITKGLKYKYLLPLLNKVIITNNNYHNLLEEAGFFDQTNQIMIYTKYLARLNFKNDENTAEYLYELFFHEYNHFLANIFLKNNLNPHSQKIDQNIYVTKNGTRVIQNWNKNFVDEFKRILNYDKNTKLYPKNKIYNKYYSLGSVYNQKDLFDIANGQAKPLYSKLKGNEIMSPNKSILAKDNINVISSKNLAYLYSLDELVARKMQIINMQYQPTKKYGQNKNLEFFDNEGIIHYFDNQKRISPYLEDILNFKGKIHSNDFYLQDIPTNQLKNLFKKYITPSNDITFLRYKNNKFIDKLTGKIKQNIDYSKLIFGGYILPEFSNIGYEANNHFINLKIFKFNNFYILKSPIDVNIIKNKKLYFAKNKNGKNKKIFNLNLNNNLTSYTKQAPKNIIKVNKNMLTISNN